jgi:hypothetical protein
MVHPLIRMFWYILNLANENGVWTNFEWYGTNHMYDTYHRPLHLLIFQLSPYHIKSSKSTPIVFFTTKITPIVKLFLILIVIVKIN